jgi:electron transport complex protein RnfB
MDLVTRIDAELPQTQCTRCGYPTCLDYAQAIASGAAAINRCPPGGAPTIAALAQLLEVPVLPLDEQRGVEQAWPLAWIDESLCIGCTKCIQACPVDAIIGGAKLMHTVIAELCTGCELCLPPCPVDCIEIHHPQLPPSADPARQRPESLQARRRFEAAADRQQRRAELREEKMQHKRDEWSRDHAQELLAAALRRAQAKRATKP